MNQGLDFQSIIFNLQTYWASQGCLSVSLLATLLLPAWGGHHEPGNLFACARS